MILTIIERETMSRIPYANLDDSPDKIRAFFEKMKANDVEMLNIHRMVAHSDAAIREFIRIGSRLLTGARLEPRFRELAILKIAQIHGARYEWAHHVPIALGVGVSNQQVKELGDWQRSDVFSDNEKTVLKYTEEVVRENRPSDETFENALRFLDRPSLVELTLSIGYWSMVAKFLLTFRVDIEEDFLQQHKKLLEEVGDI